MDGANLDEDGATSATEHKKKGYTVRSQDSISPNTLIGKLHVINNNYAAYD